MTATLDPSGTAAAFAALGDRSVRLAAAIEARRVPPAWIVAGPDEEAGEDLALEVATWLVEPDALRRAAVRGRILGGSHPDVHRVRRDKPTVISVAALAEHLERAHATPREGARQVFIVTPADALEPEGIARYLKTLEEPPDRTTFLLVTSRPQRLPTAVTSRCQVLVVPPVHVEELTAALVADGADAAKAREAARRAGGSLTRARRLLDGGLLDAFDRFVDLVLDVQPHVTDAVAMVEAAAKACAKASEDLPVFVVVQEIVRLATVLARDMAANTLRDAAPAGSEGAVSVDAVLAFADQVDELSGAAAVHVAPAVVFAELARRLRLAVRGSSEV
ncbi:MAG: hypothetical protein AB7T63_14780 [Planctomycetota bacterium]